MHETYDVFTELSAYRKPMTVIEVANLLGISKQSVYGYIKNGSLPALQLGTIIRINPRDVARWIESHQTAIQPLRRAA